jgi:hypothetical protein
MFDSTPFLLLAALVASPDLPEQAPTANDSVLASVVSPLVRPGERVRVLTRFGITEGVSGPVGPAGVQLRHDGAEVWDKPRVEALTWSQIERIERRSRGPGDGVKIGAAFGCLLGISAVAAAAASSSDAGLGGVTILLGGAVGGIAGGCVGGLLGVLVSPGGSWKTVYERR